METFSVLLALCAGNSPNRWIPHTKASDAELWCFFYLRPNKWLSKQPWGWWFETPWWSLWRHCNALANIALLELLPWCSAMCTPPWSQVFATHLSGIRKSLLWRHNGHHGVSNHQPHECLLNRSFKRRSKKTWNSPETGEFPAQMASDAENVSIWWRHHMIPAGVRSANELQWFHFILSDFTGNLGRHWLR